MGPPESGAIEDLVASSAGESSLLVGISEGLLEKIGEAMLVDTAIVKWSVTGGVDCPASPSSLLKTKETSTREMFSELNEREI